MTKVLLSSLGFVLYTYVGYPALTYLRARLFPRPVRPQLQAQPQEMPKVSVVIAAYLEATTLPKKLASLAEQSYPPDRLEVLIACDGSDPATVAAAKREGAALPSGMTYKVLELPRVGKPSALNAAVAQAAGEVLVMTDARQELNPEAIAALVEVLSDPTVGVVSGELVLSGEQGAGAYWRYEAWLRKNEALSGSVIGVSGALYAMHRRLYRDLPPETILDDLLVPMNVRLAHPELRVVFTEKARAYDQACEDRREFQRKARTLAGNFQLLFLSPGLFVPSRNPSFLGFVSHKICRLLVPYALVSALAATFVGCVTSPSLLLFGMLAGQLLCYGLALFVLYGGRAGEELAARFAPARLCATFVTLNAAAVAGFVRTLRSGVTQSWT